MYKKVVNVDGELESLNDKRTSCILLLKGLLTLLDNFRSKLFTLQILEVLEEMVTFSRGIYILIARFMENYAERTIVSMHKKCARFYPLIRQARQMEIFSVMSDMIQMLNALKKCNYFHTCNKVYILNSFLTTLKPSLTFLEKFLLKNSHFHVVLPPPEKKERKYIQKYY